MAHKTAVFDFDGVIHSYNSGWQGAGVIPDPVVPGIADLIERLRTHGLRVVVVSTRCSSEVGMEAVKRYLAENHITVDAVLAEKPPAICYVDDRAICFRGNTEKMFDQIMQFKSWVEDPQIQLADLNEIRINLVDPAGGDIKDAIQALANQRVTIVERNPHPIENLRPCKGTYFNKDGGHEVYGRFHCWGSDCLEFESGGCTFSTAIIELDDGRIVTCNADTVHFLDR